MSIAPNLPLSVVIPVYNEELNLPTLFTRLYPVLDGLAASTRSSLPTTARTTVRSSC